MKHTLRYTSLIAALNLTVMIPITYAQNVSVQQFWQRQQQQPHIIIDVRTPNEFSQGHLDSAINVPYQDIATIVTIYKDKGQPILLYCKSGRRAEVAAATLHQLGYTAVYNGRNYQDLNAAQPHP
ncbi:rhodanese-like domain-containing protein [Photobacterium sp. S4TG1]|uniref:rhodanese-like domain-containing protein n=1 Tax=Photobacterium sp. S4TG1 TaxID=3114587 RepID=UPI002E183563|nr:rhodanese-like domain-containing protein [Photobacterium sp. S4TG1]